MFDDDGRLVAYTVRYRDKVNELNARSVIILFSHHQAVVNPWKQVFFLLLLIDWLNRYFNAILPLKDVFRTTYGWIRELMLGNSLVEIRTIYDKILTMWGTHLSHRIRQICEIIINCWEYEICTIQGHPTDAKFSVQHQNSVEKKKFKILLKKWVISIIII